MLRHFVALADKYELGGIFHNGQNTISLRTTLEELGHQQTPTLIETDNSTALYIINSTLKKKNQRNVHKILLGQG